MGRVSEAASRGTELSLLEAMRDRLAEAVDDPDCPKRELASLTLRLHNVVKEIKALKSADGEDEIGEAAKVPDAPLDAETL